MKHDLKTDPEVFDAVQAGLKTFEIRKDDRGFQVGDILHLQRTRYTGAEMAAGKPLEYTGFVLDVGVSHVLRGPIYGLQDGWVILSIQPSVQKVPEGAVLVTPMEIRFGLGPRVKDVPRKVELAARRLSDLLAETANDLAKPPGAALCDRSV